MAEMEQSRPRVQSWEYAFSGVPKSSGIEVDGKWYLARSVAGDFHAVEAAERLGDKLRPRSGGVDFLYEPIAPGTTLAELEGAKHAHDDGEFWHFTGAKPEQHHAAETLAEAALVVYFQPRINKASAHVHAQSDITSRTLAHNALVALIEFVDAALADAEAKARAFHMGEKGHDDHRAIALAAVTATGTAWAKTAETDVVVRAKLASIQSAINDVSAELGEKPAVETRLGRAARLEAERKAAEAAKKAAEATPAETPEA